MLENLLFCWPFCPFDFSDLADFVTPSKLLSKLPVDFNIWS